MRQISELEGKISTLQSGRVIPEITLAAEEGPTTHQLDQKIRIAERKQELAAEANEARNKEQPRLSVGAAGVSFSSADTNFTLRLKGVVQLDSRYFADDNPLLKGNTGFLIRRARPILEATLYRDFDFVLIPEFGGSSPTLLDAYLNYRYRPELQLRAGRFKTPVGLEQLQSDSFLPFNERSLVSSLLPNRNIGLQLWGDIGNGTVNYAAGIFNGAGDGRNAGTSAFDDDKEYAARVFAQPFLSSKVTALRGFGFGLAGTFSQINSNANGLPATTGSTLSTPQPGYATDGQQQFFAYNPVLGTAVADGDQWRLSPQLSYLYGPFGLVGEYAISHQSVFNGSNLRRAGLDQKAWELSAQWVLSGEQASFTGITPARPFSLSSGGWGAWQLVGRFGELNLDDRTFQGFANAANSANAATAWAVGINWWLNRNARVLTSFSHTTFEGGGAFNPLDSTTLVPPTTVNRQDENVFFTRLQLAF